MTYFQLHAITLLPRPQRKWACPFPIEPHTKPKWIVTCCRVCRSPCVVKVVNIALATSHNLWAENVWETLSVPYLYTESENQKSGSNIFLIRSGKISIAQRLKSHLTWFQDSSYYSLELMCWLKTSIRPLHEIVPFLVSLSQLFLVLFFI